MLVFALALLASQTGEPAFQSGVTPHISAQTQRQPPSRFETDALARLAILDCTLLQKVGSPNRSVVRPLIANDRPLGDQRPNVQMIYLLERRVNGCPAPLVVIDRLPQADQSIGRIIGPG